MGMEKEEEEEEEEVDIGSSVAPPSLYSHIGEERTFFLQKMGEMVCFRPPWERLSSGVGVEWVLLPKKGPLLKREMQIKVAHPPPTLYARVLNYPQF